MMLDKLKKVFVKGVVAPVPILEQQTFHLVTDVIPQGRSRSTG